jgi:protein required for attachment to host cells
MVVKSEKSERTWIVIADGAHAKVLQFTAEKPRLETVKDIAFKIDLPRTHDIVSDRPGRAFESRGHARHAKSGRSDPHRELKRDLAHKVAGALQMSLADKRFDKLVLVAPPATVGDLREALAKGVRACVTAEVAQDLVKIPASQLQDHLADVLPLKLPGVRTQARARVTK